MCSVESWPCSVKSYDLVCVVWKAMTWYGKLWLCVVCKVMTWYGKLWPGMCIGESYDLVCVVWKAMTWYVECGLLYVQTLTDCKLGCVKNNGIWTITAIVHSITIVQTFLNYNEIGIIYLCILYSQIKQLVILFELCYYISRIKKNTFPRVRKWKHGSKTFFTISWTTKLRI